MIQSCSNCCQASVVVSSSGEGTNSYVCTKCGKACDVMTQRTPEEIGGNVSEENMSPSDISMGIVQRFVAVRDCLSSDSQIELKEAIEEAIQAERERAEAWERDAKWMKSECEKAGEKITSLERSLEEAKAKIEMLEAERGNYDDKDALRVAGDQIKALEAELAAARHMVKANSDSVEINQKALHATAHGLEKANEEIARLKAEVERKDEALTIIKQNCKWRRTEAEGHSYDYAEAALAQRKEP